MGKDMKALVIQAPYETDLGNILQIARAEAMKIFHKPNKIKVLELISFRHGWVAVVQNGDGSISENLKHE